MLLNIIIILLMLFSIVYGALSGTLPELSKALIDGAGDAVSLCIGFCGMICLWSGAMELMKRSGLSEKLSKLLLPVLGRLFPSARRDPEIMDALSTNVSANLLGLGNAATPAGIRAAQGLKRLSGGDTASNELCLLVIMNTASIQLIPTTVAALRASLGSGAPFDILPAVWASSALALAAGIFTAKLLGRAWR